MIADDAIVVLVKELEYSFEFTWTKHETDFFKYPLAFCAVESLIAILIKLFEKSAQSADSSRTFGTKSCFNLINNLFWCLSGKSKDWIDVRIIACSLKSKPSSKFFKVNLSVLVFVSLVEKSCHLFL